MSLVMHRVSAVSALGLGLVLIGCGHGTSTPVAGFTKAVPLHGSVFGGQQPFSDALLQLYAVSTSGTGSASTALISTTLTTSDGSGQVNSNANAGNANNTLPVGYFTITGDYTCPSQDSQVYLTANGGNPGMTAGTNNTAMSLMVSLGSCGLLSSSTNLVVDEVTTVGSVAALYPYMTGYNAIGSVAGDAPALAEEFSVATEYSNFTTGMAPGPNLQSGYYASSTEINTLANAVASCVNTAGDTGPSSTCDMLFQAAKPSGGTAPTDTIGALIDILKNPAHNVVSIFSLASPQGPFQPVLASAPSDWTLPILPVPVSPAFSPKAGMYAGAQNVSIASATTAGGVALYYTTNGTPPTTSSNQYTGPIAVSSNETLKAIAVGRAGSATGSASYTFTGSAATPVISPGTGAYTTPQLVTITSATPDAAIYFTTNGSAPTSASNLYTSAIQVSQTETLQAVAIYNSASSGTASAAYTFGGSGSIIATFAGGAKTSSSGPATSIPIQPSGVAIDTSGNLYLADIQNNVVRKIAAGTGAMTIVAGSGVGGYTGDGGPATSARLSIPYGIAVDASGNIYIADSQNSVIRKVAAATGIITTVAGNGTPGFSGNGSLATSAKLNTPYGVAVDASSNLYIADTQNSVIREVTASTGNIAAFAGTGASGYSGDSGPATSAKLYDPVGVALDASGNLYISDTANGVIRRVAAGTLTISTVAGNYTLGASYSGDNNPATSAQLKNPYGITVDAAGNLYIADFSNNVIREVMAGTGNITTIAGNGTVGYTGDNGAATSAELDNPFGVAVDANGNLYISDRANNVVREVTASTGNITTIAGSQARDYTGNNGPAIEAQLFTPQGLAVDTSGNVYIADSDNEVIHEVAASTGIITFAVGNGTAGYTGDNSAATSAELNTPDDVAIDASGNLYIADAANNVIRKVAAGTGIITTIAGTGTAGYSGDGGPATSAKLNLPVSLALDTSGNLYIDDAFNTCVRKVIKATGFITTFAGTCGTAGYTGDNGPATSAGLNFPKGIAIDASGNLYIADTNNNVVREVVASSGNITTIAGSPSGTAGYTGDNGPAASAELYSPEGLALDTVGNLYIADTNNVAIRKVAAGTNTITTFAGDGTRKVGNTGDGGPPTSAEFSFPTKVAVDAHGDVYISDTGNRRVRVVYP